LGTYLGVPALLHSIQIDLFLLKLQEFIGKEVRKILQELLSRATDIAGETSYFLGFGNDQIRHTWAGQRWSEAENSRLNGAAKRRR
jgi:hypothetical protein